MILPLHFFYLLLRDESEMDRDHGGENHVGSKEGWAPSGFKSSRDKRAETRYRAEPQKPSSASIPQEKQARRLRVPLKQTVSAFPRPLSLESMANGMEDCLCQPHDFNFS